jgi:hypothetical protein
MIISKAINSLLWIHHQCLADKIAGLKTGHVMILFGLPIVGIDFRFVRIMTRVSDRSRSLPTKRIKTRVLRIIVEGIVENHRIPVHIAR